ncbi:RNA polymerase sigma factor [Marinicaulis aureus]|uniref:RNA polymerase sigma factor n=1 Tax=Hyphococcus aureus TaxID=2666033 RepID=A0ABW1L0V5_9PROT
MQNKDENPPSEHGTLASAFLRYRESLRRYIARLTIRPEDVEDILQDTFVSVHRLESAESIRSPKFYLYAVARRTAYRELKRQAARVAESIDEAIEKGDEPAADIAPLDEALESRRYFETLSDVVAELSPQCRRVFVLRKVFGFSHKEISAAMGISISTTEKYLARAMARCLQDHRLSEFRDGNETDGCSQAAPVQKTMPAQKPMNE